MAYFTADNFIVKYGWETFERFLTMLNDGKQLSDIAELLGVSVSTVHRWRVNLLDTKYVPKEDTKRCLLWHMEKLENRHMKKIELIEECEQIERNASIIIHHDFRPQQKTTLRA